MGRKKKFEKDIVVSIRLEEEDYRIVQEIAALEQINSGHTITAQDMIRHAIKYVFLDGERLRDSFRKSRKRIDRHFKNSIEE